MNKILFPLEYSTNAKNNFLYALDWAKKVKASLMVMHALGHSESNVAGEKEWNEKGKEAMDKLIDFVEENSPRKYQSVNIEYVIQLGDPATAIQTVTEEENIDMIVMGMRAHTTPLVSYFSSVAMEVISQVEIPVLMIPDTNKFEEIKNMTYTFNFEFKELSVIQQLLKWSKSIKTTLKCLHVLENDEDEKEMEHHFYTIKELFKQNKKYGNLISFDITAGKFEEIIEFLAKEKEMDLLVMLSRQRNFKTRFMEPSTANKIARKLDIPVLILKQEYIFKHQVKLKYTS